MKFDHITSRFAGCHMGSCSAHQGRACDCGAKPLAPVAHESILRDWLLRIHDNELSIGDRLQGLSSRISLLLAGGAASEPYVIREQSIQSTWHDFRAGDLPASDGEVRLVLLEEDNEYGYAHTYALQAWYGVFKDAPNAWTIDGDDVTADVLQWTPLPPPPGAAIALAAEASA
jgi:hypothetical protein